MRLWTAISNGWKLGLLCCPDHNKFIQSIIRDCVAPVGFSRYVAVCGNLFSVQYFSRIFQVDCCEHYATRL